MSFIAEDGDVQRGLGRKPTLYSARVPRYPHSRKLIGAWLFNERAGGFMDWSGRRHHAFRTGTSTQFYRKMDRKEGRIFVGEPTTQIADSFDVGSITSGHDLSLNNSSAVTLMWREKHTDTFYTGTNDFNRIIDRATGGSGVGGWAFYWDSSGSLNRLIFAQANNTGGLDPTGTYIDTWRTYCVTKDTSGNLELFMNEDSPNTMLNMSSVDTGTVSGSPGASTANFLLFNANSTNRPYEGEIAYLYIWNRVLGLDEINIVARRPYDMFHEPRNNLYWARSEPATAGDFQPGRSRIIGGD